MMRSPKRFPVPLVHINETNSTNNYLQALCARQQTEEFTTVVADFQTSGRGQRGNSWEAEPDKNLLFSFVIFPSLFGSQTTVPYLSNCIISNQGRTGYLHHRYFY